MKWLLFAAINAVGSSLNNLLVKLASGKISPLVGAIFVYLGGLLVLVVLFPILGEKVVIDKQGLWLSILAGMALGIASAAWFKMYNSGAPMSLATAVTLVAIVVLATVYGVVFFHERLSLKQFIGLVVSIAGLYLLLS